MDCGFQRFSRTWFVNYLCQDWIPAMPDDRRAAAGRRLDGRSRLRQRPGPDPAARCYPEARLVGFDLHAPAIEAARANAEAAGVGDRIRFEVLDAAEGIPGAYDLITCFDVVHDMPFPARRCPRSARRWRRAAASSSSSSTSRRAAAEHRPPLRPRRLGLRRERQLLHDPGAGVGGDGDGTCMGARPRAAGTEAGFSESACSTSRRTRST
jgi:hypothetical protein